MSEIDRFLDAAMAICRGFERNGESRLNEQVHHDQPWTVGVIFSGYCEEFKNNMKVKSCWRC